MADTLVIGIGGTGIKTLIHVKKQIQDQRPDGQLPPYIQILGIDTVTAPEKIYDIGVWESATARRRARDYEGEASLNPNTEFIYIGGNAHYWICENSIKSGKFLNWFNDRYFCDHLDSESLLNITQGVGMFRQIGRLALHFALRQGRTSIVYQILEEKIRALSAQNINVIICASLAGGTGSALYIDIAHLIKKIAASLNKQAGVGAMMVLPEAFRWTAPIVINDSMRGSAIAAIRELMRFLTIHSVDIGFRMMFCDGNDPILDSRSRGSVIDQVYLFDERWTPPGRIEAPNPLNVRIEHGVVPTLATWITALVDRHTQDEVLHGLINRDALICDKAWVNAGFVPAVAGSVGTYSYVLPITAIIEDWTMRLACEALDLLAPKKDDGSLDSGMFGGVPGVEALHNVIKGWKDFYIRVGEDIGKIGPEYSSKGDNQILIDQISKRMVRDWSEVVLPPANTNDAAIDEYQNTFEEMGEEKIFFYKKGGLFSNPLKGALVQEESIKSHKNNPIAAAKVLEMRCNEVEQGLLSKWEPIIDKFVEAQVEVFQQELLTFANQVLQGVLDDTAENAKVNRGGKLGWLLQYVGEILRHLEHTRALLEDAINVKSHEVRDTLQDIDKENMDGKYVAMQISARKQKGYLEARQKLFDCKRWNLLCEAEKKIVECIHAYTDELQKRLFSYANILQIGTKNI